MDDKEELPVFLEYREHPKFKGIDSAKARLTYPAYANILICVTDRRIGSIP